jgi:hypothetical protein
VEYRYRRKSATEETSSFTIKSARDEFGILVFAYLGFAFLNEHCLLKYILEIHLSNFSFVLEFIDEKSMVS